MKSIIIKGINFIGNKIPVLEKLLFPVRDKIIFNTVKKIYDQALVLKDDIIRNNTSNNSNVIWVFWAQGYDKAPKLVKKCIDNIKRCINGYKVIVIDMNNIRDYVDIPEYIFNKVESKKITLTHFSDILRINLIAKYGGIWMDSTVFVDENINNLIIDNKQIITIPQTNIDYNISEGKWSAWMIGTKEICDYFNIFRKFFNIYWEKYDRLICYFLIDYLFEYAYRNNQIFKENIDLVKEIEFSVYDLVEKRNELCTKNEFEKFMHNNYINKLNYKLDYSFEKLDTYAFHIINK